MQYFAAPAGLRGSENSPVSPFPLLQWFSIEYWNRFRSDNCNKYKRLSALIRVWFRRIKTAKIKGLRG
jgi:hypothetical protein